MAHKYTALTALLVATALLKTLNAQAQQTGASSKLPPSYNNTLLTPSEFQTYLVFDQRYEGIRGTPYLVQGWNTAELLLTDKRRVENIPARYDVYRRMLIVRPNGGRDSLWLDATRVSEFVLTSLLPNQGNRRFRVFAEAPDPAMRSSFVEVLHQGSSYSLLKLPHKTLVKASYQGAYSADRRFDELADRTEYFLRRPDGTLTDVKLSRKSLAAAAPALQAELTRTKLDIRTEQDAVTLVRAVDGAK